uniref:Small ribosomal subunit protein mS26 n=1 Tax=Astyanax mexicanus TaxID=7994 RepID=A0A3B1KKW3_ASTMX
MFQAVVRSRTPVVRFLSPRAGVLLETVRGRKSRTDPKAKSKAGRIKTPSPVDPVEMVVLKERFTEYNLIMRALRMEFKEEMLRKRYEEETGSLAEERAKQESEEHRSLMAWNDAENLRLRKIRRRQRTSLHWKIWMSGLKRRWTIRKTTTLPLIKRAKQKKGQCFNKGCRPIHWEETENYACLVTAAKTTLGILYTVTIVCFQREKVTCG